MKPISRRELFLTLPLATVAVGRMYGQQPTKIEVYKDPSCGCCGIWVAHLRSHGFAPTVSDTAQMTAVKNTHRAYNQLRSCHTALVGGYVIEGHVPAADVQRLLKEKPKVLGLAVPGMPVGSPGMEGPGGRPYDVLTFDAAGKTAVYSTQQPSSRA